MLSFDQLIQSLTDTTQPSVVRSTAIESLVERGDARGVKFLIDALADSDSMVRREAAKGLQNLGATGAIEPLLEALQAESKDLTVWAMLEAIGELGNPKALPLLESLSNVDSILTRIEVKKCISRIHERYGNGNAPEVPEAEETIPAQTHTTQDPELVPSQETPLPDSGAVEAEAEVEEMEENPDSLLSYLINRANAQTSRSAKAATDEPDEEQTSVSTEDTFEEPSVDADQIDGMDPEEIADEQNYWQSIEAERENLSEAEFDETELAEDIVTDTEFPETEEDAEIYDTEPPESEVDTEIPDTRARESDEDTEIENLVKSISRSPRLAGSSVALPVLAPNASTVPYHPNVAPTEEKSENFFLAVLHPGRYLSKRWVSRTRAYLILWIALLAATIGFTQFQKHQRVEKTPLLSMGLSDTEVPGFVKRALAEGDFYIQEGYYRHAISAYQLSRDLGALPVQSYRKLGFAYFKEGQYALAAEAYELFLEERKKVSPSAFIAEASLSGMYPSSSVEAKVVQDYETYNILGTIYMKLGRLQDSQRAYEQAIHLAPKYGEAYNNLARLYVDGYQQKLRLAETLAYTAVTLNPDVAAYYDTLGWILSKRGQVNKAMKTLERAINLQRDAAESHYHLAQVALKANKRQKAIKSIRQVLKLNPAYVHLNTANEKR
ncbi:MAG: HEAT repeat domain-containing protein [Candidatus Poribacteria bacterium]|nr:HEAT repeat domain-containing protein [Candidatus Poribacteria bacterium]